MSKPSEEIKIIFEELMKGRIKADGFSDNELSVIIQAIIFYLDITYKIDETRKQNKHIPNNLPPKK